MSSGNAKDVAAGLIFVAVGLAFGSMALGLDLGTARRMGPGYFPLVLAAIMVVLGAVIVWQGARRPAEAIGRMPWRGLLLIVATPILFGLTLRGIGLVPAILGVVLISAAASTMSRLLPTVALAVGLTVFCALVFIKGLGLPIVLFGPWVTFAHTPPAAVQPAPAETAPAGSGG
ncbi:MAG TPA: tripartite tricarboxylate transporter TctB family protein [Geminicoccaceae bacterium]|nr:tripartite tricarboxylate transporter TctB family protein [Geminicoccus sp.]HMU50197.1 tripartite tricarboxylate transporter TctB family protein [Geminicoccaceae bacterium]